MKIYKKKKVYIILIILILCYKLRYNILSS